MAEGWTHNYGLRIREMEGGFLYLRLDDGRSLPYRRTVGGMYTPVFGDRGIVRKDRDGFLYCTPDNTEYTFDGRGLLLTRKDRNGNTDSFFHNASGQLMKVSGACGGEFTYTYNREGNLIRVEDHTGRMVRLRYRYGRLWQFVNESGQTYTYGYNEDGRLESIVTPRGITGVYNEYDAANRVVKQVLPDGGVAEMMYDDENMRSYVKNPDGSMVVHEMDERMRNVKNIYADGEETFGYNDNNQRTFYVDKNGNKTKYRYDGRGNLAAVTNALGQVTEYTYDSGNRLLTVKECGKIISRNAYDEEGRLVKSTDALGRSRRIVYNGKGLPEQLEREDGSLLYVRYDDRGNIIGTTDSNGVATAYTYDILNRLVMSADAEGNAVCYEYDAESRVTAVINPEGNTRTYTYNESGEPVCIRDFDGNGVTVEYDCMNRPGKITDKEDGITLRRYDLMGNLAEEISPSGAVTTYTYDRNGHMVKTELRKTGEEAESSFSCIYEYDPVGNVLHGRVLDGGKVTAEVSHVYDVLDRVIQTVDPVGNRTEYDYRPDGHLGGIVYGDGSRVELEYTPLGQIALVRDWNGETKIERNRQGRPVRVTDHTGKTVEYEWGAMGEKKSMTYPDGKKIRYGYDGQLRLEKLVREERGKTDLCITYRYDGEGRLSEKNAGGLCTVWQYNAVGLPEELIHRDGRDILDRYRYEYDAVGNKTGIKKERKGLPGENGTYGFLYDPLNRLTDVEKDGKPIRKYIYDSFGNRTGMMDYSAGRTYIYTYNMLNQLAGEEIWEGDVACTWSGGIQREADMIKTYAYDLRGNLISECTGETQSRRYVYNAGNRLSEFRDSRGMQSLYCYNGLGYRTAKVSGDRKETYFLDLMAPGGRLLEFQRGEERQNIYWDLSPAAVEDTGKSPRYYMNDELGSPLRVLYATGRGSAYGYDEFGNDLHDMHGADSFGTPYAKQGEEQPFGYTGYRYDGDSGTYFAQAREYDAGRGRFMARDTHWNADNSIYGDIPAGGFVPNMDAVRQSTNVYAYCMNNPVRYVDLLGGEAGDTFKSMDDAAKDFAETMNAESIEKDIEYGAYIYAWEVEVEKKIFGFIPFGTEKKRYYSYTEPHTNNFDDRVEMDPYNKAELPEKKDAWMGKVWPVAGIHTHGAYKQSKESIETGKYLIKDTDIPSDIDEDWSKEFSRLPIYVVTPIGTLRSFDPNEKSVLNQHKKLVNEWKLPHDKNHPLREENHKKECENCYPKDSETATCTSDK